MLNLNPSWFTFFSFSILGLFLISSGNNWFSVWIGFEISLLGFIPMFTVSSVVVEGLVNYFLVQSSGSGLFLLSYMCNSDGGVLLFFWSMFLKLGLFPFFYWVPVVMVCLSWMGCLLLSTLQKLGPFIIIVSSNWSFNLYWVILFSSLSVLVGGVIGFNQTNLRSLMAYSSISHGGWILSVIFFSFNLFLLYFLSYCLLSVFLFTLFELYNYFNVGDFNVESARSLGVSLFILVLSGIPPFIVFFLKLMVFTFLVNYPGIVLLIVFGAYFSVYFYFVFLLSCLIKGWNGMFFEFSGLIRVLLLFSVMTFFIFF